MASSFDATTDEAGAFEDADVLGRGLEGHGEGCGELADGELVRSQPAEHRPTRVMSERVEHFSHALFLNHAVEYRYETMQLSTK